MVGKPFDKGEHSSIKVIKIVAQVIKWFADDIDKWYFSRKKSTNHVAYRTPSKTEV